jgi:hypothetical protein
VDAARRAGGRPAGAVARGFERQGAAGPEGEEEAREEHAGHLDEAGRKFNADKLDGISRRDRQKPVTHQRDLVHGSIHHAHEPAILG